MRLRRGLSQCLRPATLRAARRACGYPGRRCVFDIAIVSAPPVVLCWLFLPGRGMVASQPGAEEGMDLRGGRGCPTGVGCPSSRCSDPLWFSRRSPGSEGVQRREMIYV